MPSPTAWKCDVCRTPYDTEEKAIHCEVLHRKVRDLAKRAICVSRLDNETGVFHL